MKTCASTSNGKDIDLILTAEGSGNRSAPCAVHIKTAVTALCPSIEITEWNATLTPQNGFRFVSNSLAS